jgi:hypothetical protein
MQEGMKGFATSRESFGFAGLSPEGVTTFAARFGRR